MFLEVFRFVGAPFDFAVRLPKIFIQRIGNCSAMSTIQC